MWPNPQETDLILILWVKRLQAVINGNKPEMDETGSETEIKDNGGKSALFSLKDKAILYYLLNLLWFQQMMTLKTSIESNIDSGKFQISFFH